MRTCAQRKSVVLHTDATNVGVDDHHLRPRNVEVSNTTQSIPPLPGGPGRWDIPLPSATRTAKFLLRGPITTQPGGPAKVGVWGNCSEQFLETSTVSFGYQIGSSNYGAVYSQAAGALYLSHKMFSTVKGEIALSSARIVTVGVTKYLRLEFTNFAAGFRTLMCWAEIQVAE